jgi:hypothetical protein
MRFEFNGCNNTDGYPLSCKSGKALGNNYCYLYSSNDYYYGSNEIEAIELSSIDFYFKTKNITAITSEYLSVGTITIRLFDLGNCVFILYCYL